MDLLTELANKYGCDRGDKHFEKHNYTPIYDKLFSPIRENHVKMMEIGINDPRFPGASIKMWQDYFKDLEFVGYDINPQSLLYAKDNISIFIGDQNSTKDLYMCTNLYGGEFDVIIDDGSHITDHILTSFKVLFPYVKNGGYYIIEDLHAYSVSKLEIVLGINKYMDDHHIERSGGYECDDKLLIIKKSS